MGREEGERRQGRDGKEERGSEEGSAEERVHIAGQNAANKAT